MASPIPLKDMLSAIDRGNTHFYRDLTPEQQKAFSPWTAMRYASSVNGKHAEHYILMVNDFVNDHFTDLNKHPELQWQLLSVCGIGANQFHKWLKPGKKKGKNKVQAAISKLFPNMKSDELDLFEALHTKKEIKQIFKDSGYTDKEIKAIL